MPGCVLRVASADFKVDDFLKTSTLNPCDIYRRGEPKGLTINKPNDKSGITVVVSEADGDSLLQQVQDALDFLEQNKEEIRRLRSQVDPDGITLDFGIWRKAVFGQFCYLPPRLLQIAGELEIGIELSIYQ